MLTGQLQVILHRRFAPAFLFSRQEQPGQLGHALGPLRAADRSGQDDVAEDRRGAGRGKRVDGGKSLGQLPQIKLHGNLKLVLLVVTAQ